MTISVTNSVANSVSNCVTNSVTNSVSNSVTKCLTHSVMASGPLCVTVAFPAACPHAAQCEECGNDANNDQPID